jgi:serine/threonine protein kinase
MNINHDFVEDNVQEKLLSGSIVWLLGKMDRIRALRSEKEEDSETKIPKRISKYEIISSLGKGDRGAVYQAFNPNTDSEVAVKVLSPKMECSPAGIPRFEQEAKLTSKIKHPNMVQVLDAGYDDKSKCHFIVSEFVKGGNLNEFMACSDGRIPVQIAIDITFFVAKALKAIHKHGIIHRDIKPANIIVSNQGEVKLTDLGTAKLVSANIDLTSTGNILGTPAYISPEQIDCSKNMDARTDIYSLGATLYHLVSGKHAFPGKNPYEIIENVFSEPTPHLSSVMPEIPANVAGIIYKMMAKNVVDRFQSLYELLLALVEIREQQSEALSGTYNSASLSPQALISNTDTTNEPALVNNDEQPPRVLPILKSLDDM